ncbi:MAG: Ig-like domain-containing protein [Pseudomonadota bacterium]
MTKMRTSVWAVSALSTALFIAGCGGNSGGGTTAASSSPKISGVVTVSSTAAKGSATLKALNSAPHGKPGSAMYKATMGKGGGAYNFLPSVPARKGFANAEVFLYDADHPEWKSPVAETTTDSTGAYSLNIYMNASLNGSAYSDGATLADGHYTLIASKYDPTLGATLVAMQSVAQDVAGSVAGNNLEAVPSDVVPSVDTVVGQSKNTDGTETWGATSVSLAPNGTLQVAFNMPMARDTVTSGIALSPADAGTWEVSPDWTLASFRPTSGSLQANTAYMVTVKGDDLSKSGAVKNVYGNRLAKTGYGYFTTSAANDTTAPTVSLTSPSTTTGVDPTTAIKITSNDQLDVTKLTLSLTPSLGSKPEVNYTFVNATTHVYELVTAITKGMGVNYVGSITGLKDLAGNVATTISVDFTTSSTVTGVSTVSTDTSIAAVQVASADLFTKWIGAMNDRDIGKWQGLTAGNFAMDYNLANGFDSTDVNRDGVYSLDEFSALLSNQAFPMWKYCGTTLVGTVVDAMNVDAANNKADFKFTLTGTSTVGGKDCSDATPKESLFATVRKIGGYWKVEHASIGIDTRGQSIGQVTAMSLVGPAEDTVLLDSQMGPPTFKYASAAGATFAYTAGSPLRFEWSAVTGATTYVFIVMSADDPKNGMALAIPSDKTVLDFSDPNAMPQQGGGGGTTAGGATSTSPNHPVSKDFGFDDKFEPGAGSSLMWQIAALGSNTVTQIKQGTNSSLSKDLKAISELRRILIGGVNTSTKVGLKAQDGGTGTVVPYNINYNGFDITGVTGHTGTVDITLTSESLTNIFGTCTPVSPATTCVAASSSDNIGRLWLDGAFRQEFPLDFDPDTNGTVVQTQRTAYDIDPAVTAGITVYKYSVTITVPLTKGWNHFSMLDHAMSCGTNCFNGGPGSRWRDFNVNTTAGITPVLAVTGVQGSTSTAGTAGATYGALTGDAWQFYNAGVTPTTGVKSVRVAGTITGRTISTLEINLWNNALMINKHVSVPMPAPVTGVITYSFDMDIYTGDNWINLGGNACGFTTTGAWDDCRWLNANFGVRSDNGSVYTPPISITSVAAADANGVATTTLLTATDSFGNFKRYDASTVTTNKLIISGVMTNFQDPNPNATYPMRPMYNVGGDGGWKGGELTVDATGNFTIAVDLFNGYNNVGVNDTAFNWMGMEIYTSLGKTVIKPTITSVSTGTYTAGLNGMMGKIDAGAACFVTINGTAKQGEVRVAWRSQDDNGTPTNYGDDVFNWEEQVAKAGTPSLGDDGLPHAFTVTIPVVSRLVAGSKVQNFVDINDTSWLWLGTEVTTTGTCVYSAPTVTATLVSTATDTTGVAITGTPGSAMYPATGQTTAAAVTISGTTNRPGRAVRVEAHACGATDTYYVNAATTGAAPYAWSVPVTVYNGNQNINVMDGWNNIANVNVNSSTSTMPSPAISITGMTGTTGTAGTGSAVTITAPGGLATSCGNSNWSVGAARSISVSGTTKVGGTKLSVFVNGVMTTVTSDATTKVFILNADVYNGMNNIGINDPNWNNYFLGVTTTNGVAAPQYVEITSPIDNAVVGSTTTASTNQTVNVTGTIYSTGKAGGATAFKPDGVGGSFCDGAGCTQYSSDPNAAQWGAQPVTLQDNGNGTWTVSFSATLHTHDNGAGVMVSDTGNVNIFAWGAAGANHGASAGVNQTNAWYYKPGSNAKVDVKQQQHLIDDLQRAIAKSR